MKFYNIKDVNLSLKNLPDIIYIKSNNSSYVLEAVNSYFHVDFKIDQIINIIDKKEDREKFKKFCIDLSYYNNETEVIASGDLFCFIYGEYAAEKYIQKHIKTIKDEINYKYYGFYEALVPIHFLYRFINKFDKDIEYDIFSV